DDEQLNQGKALAQFQHVYGFLGKKSGRQRHSGEHGASRKQRMCRTGRNRSKPLNHSCLYYRADNPRPTFRPVFCKESGTLLGPPFAADGTETAIFFAARAESAAAMI